MKNSVKKLFSFVLALAMLCVFSGAVAYASDSVEINETNFPDPVFRQMMSDYYDDDGDGTLSEDERSVTYMSITAMLEDGETVSDLTGIEYFSSLQILRYSGSYDGTGLEKLDTTSLMDLTSLTCQGNALTSLDLSNNSFLERVNCSDNELETLLLPAGAPLTFLHCYANSLTSIDVSKLYYLQDFRCDQNRLTSLDISANTELTAFNCSSNSIMSLDLSANSSLGEVTEYMIGDQELTRSAELIGDYFIVDYSDSGVNSENFVSSTLDSCDDGSCFSEDKFIVYDVADIADGIDYECYTYLDTSVNLDVHINVARDFYQVDFYSSDDLSNRLSKCFVQSGETATAPEVTDLEQCTVVTGWSESLENVTADLSVYPIISPSHTYAVTAFDGETVTISCTACSLDGYDVSFISCVNSFTGDDNYDEYVDVNSDGCINVKDFTILSQTFA